MNGARPTSAVARLIKDTSATRVIAHLAGTGRAAPNCGPRVIGQKCFSHGLDENSGSGWRSATAARISGNMSAAQVLLSEDHRATAILANNDYAGLIVMSHAQSIGLSVPEDLSVVGYSQQLSRPYRLYRADDHRQQLHSTWPCRPPTPWCVASTRRTLGVASRFSRSHPAHPKDLRSSPRPGLPLERSIAGGYLGTY